MNDVTKDNQEATLAAAHKRLESHLGRGWKVYRTRKGHVKARYALLSITLKYKEGSSKPWRCRMRDSIPRTTLIERRGETCADALDDVANHAVRIMSLIRNTDGLVRNESKSWIAYRLWSAVRPTK